MEILHLQVEIIQQGTYSTALGWFTAGILHLQVEIIILRAEFILLQLELEQIVARATTAIGNNTTASSQYAVAIGTGTQYFRWRNINCCSNYLLELELLLMVIQLLQLEIAQLQVEIILQHWKQSMIQVSSNRTIQFLGIFRYKCRFIQLRKYGFCNWKRNWIR